MDFAEVCHKRKRLHEEAFEYFFIGKFFLILLLTTPLFKLRRTRISRIVDKFPVSKS